MAYTIVTLLSDRKLYAAAIFFKSILKQVADLTACTLILLVDDESPASKQSAEEFACDHAEDFLRVVVLVSYPIYGGGHQYATGRHAILRQQALEHYVSLPEDCGLLFWDADQDWSEDFVETCLNSEHPLVSGLYTCRGNTLLAAFTATHQSIRDDTHIAADDALWCGLGGTWGQSQIWRAFAAAGGWRTFARLPDNHPQLYGPESEDAYFFRCAAARVRLLLGPWCWHYEQDPRNHSNTRYANAVRVTDGVAAFYRITDEGQVMPLRTRPRVGQTPPITVATLFTDTRAHAFTVFTDALEAQDYPKSRVRVLVMLDGDCPVARGYLERWIQCAGREFASVDVQEHATPDRHKFKDTPWWTGRISVLRQAALECYVALSDDDGMVWWDADTAWDQNLLSEVVACGWPLVQCIYAARNARFACTLNYDFGRSQHHPVHVGLLAHSETVNYATTGGFYGCRKFWMGFSERGGWRDYDFSEAEKIGEDGYILTSTGREAYVLRGVYAWHEHYDGSSIRLTDRPVSRHLATPQDYPWAFLRREPSGEVVAWTGN